MAGIIPLTIALLGIWLIKESTNWKKYVAEKSNKINTEQSLFSPSHRRNLLAGSLIFGTMLIGLWAIFSWLPTWVQSLSTAADAQKERGMSMMLLGMGGLTGGFFSGWLANALGLRRSMLLCFSACAILSFILFKTNTAIGPVMYAEIAVLALFFGASQGVPVLDRKSVV